ncbi:cytochrome P450 [Auriscalpium vulgare]|uniref:Cytochrome P450 n=1 Tax=Auriscalpium vulgare TaxID=40419 RepID=A0ACB8S3T4_9AGAM|nr:cytochrome P450 [Auriscalpium vulgare]
MPTEHSLPTPAAVAIIVLLLLVARWYRARDPLLLAIPTVGYSAPLLSYISAIRYLFRSKEILDEGYAKYKPGVFKIPMLNHWEVIATGPQLIEDMRKAPDNVLSFDAAVAQTLQVDYTFGPEIRHDPYHILIIRSQLTRGLSGILADVREEIVTAFDDLIPAKNTWVKVNDVQDTLRKIVCRTSNRVFVGAPLCRNEDYQRLNIDFTIDVVKAALVINLFPNFLKPVVAKFVTNIPSQLRRQIRHLEPVIEERRKLFQEHGGVCQEDRPNDMLTWFMNEAKGIEQTTQQLALRLLTVNFAAIHTSSLSFTHALYHLAANPQYIQPLRDEVETVLAAEGWTKAALGKMRKVDSFIRESQRLNGLGLVSMTRLVLQPFTFSTGVTLPPGTVLSCASAGTHTDETHYAQADTFSPFRFAEKRDVEATKHHLVSTQHDFLAFGHGRHACPGRFFAASELKAMLAHLVLTYDVKFENGQGFPPNMFVASSCVPGKADVLFRKRQL